MGSGTASLESAEWARLRRDASFRKALPVRELIYFRGVGTFPVCPRCRRSLDREFQAFCDRCGQRLGWQNLSRATIRLRF